MSKSTTETGPITLAQYDQWRLRISYCRRYPQTPEMNDWLDYMEKLAEARYRGLAIPKKPRKKRVR